MYKEKKIYSSKKLHRIYDGKLSENKSNLNVYKKFIFNICGSLVDIRSLRISENVGNVENVENVFFQKNLPDKFISPNTILLRFYSVERTQFSVQTTMNESAFLSKMDLSYVNT